MENGKITWEESGLAEVFHNNFENIVENLNVKQHKTLTVSPGSTIEDHNKFRTILQRFKGQRQHKSDNKLYN